MSHLCGQAIEDGNTSHKLVCRPKTYVVVREDVGMVGWLMLSAFVIHARAVGLGMLPVVHARL